MKLTCPINKSEEVRELIKEGAGEFYLGYVPKKWEKGLIASPNRRYFRESNFSDFKDIRKAVQIASGYDVPVFFVLNAPYYLDYKEIVSWVSKAVDCGIDSFIVADIPLVGKIKKIFPDARIIISTVACSLNSESAKFYSSLGATRVILPRQFTFEEIVKIRKKVDIELETFILFDLCRNLDGLCTFHHGIENILHVGHGCRYVNDYCSGDFRIDNRIKNVVFENFCAKCWIDRFEKIGINAVKIGGRRLPTMMKKKALRFLLSKGDSKRAYFKTFNKRCPVNCNAY
jgi:collagenase-like PrtC family protease